MNSCTYPDFIGAVQFKSQKFLSHHARKVMADPPSPGAINYLALPARPHMFSSTYTQTESERVSERKHQETHSVCLAVLSLGTRPLRRDQRALPMVLVCRYKGVSTFLSRTIVSRKNIVGRQQRGMTQKRDKFIYINTDRIDLSNFKILRSSFGFCISSFGLFHRTLGTTVAQSVESTQFVHASPCFFDFCDSK